MPFNRSGALVALTLALVSAPGTARAAATPAAPPPAPAVAPSKSDDFRITLFAGQQMDRFNPGIAASSNSVAQSGTATGVDFDYHVADIPTGRKSGPRPRVTIGGRLLASHRVLAQDVAMPVDTTAGATAHDSLLIVPDAPTIELDGSFRIAYPVASVAGEPVTAVYFRAESGGLFATQSKGDLLSTTRFGLGFERLSGTFQGSFAEVTRGHNAAFGAAHASGRYTVHVLLQGTLAPTEGSKREHSNLGAFVDLEVDTDNGGGPDGLRALMGLKLDGSGVFDAVRGLIGM